MSVQSSTIVRHASSVGSSVRTRIGTLQNHPVTWIVPALVLLVSFRLFPLLEVIRMSVTNMSLVSPEFQYVGIETYASMLSSEAFGTMTRVTLTFVIASISLQLILGMVLALAIDYGVKHRLQGSVFTRVSVLSAWVIPGIVIGILWKILLIETNYGVVNYLLLQVGLDVVSFLSDPQMALVSTIIANTWRGTAFSMIMLYAGLQNVPQQLYRAAKVDGAGPIARFRYVTLPQLKPVVFINLVLITIYTINTFDMVLSLTGGGPGRATEVLALFMYNKGFTQFDLGGAAAVAVIMLLVNVVMTLIYMRYFVSEEGL